MEHTFKIEKELKITTENIVDCVLSCEAGGFDYWGELCSDEKDYELTLEKLLNGWKKYAEDHNADDFDEYDGISADCIMQYAIFGDAIYG